jgi:alkylation response protein AidB-like acyl-CoA dehydrogenase
MEEHHADRFYADAGAAASARRSARLRSRCALEDGTSTKHLSTPLARFAATKPFYEQTVAAGFLRRLIPEPLGGQGTGTVDMAVLAEEFHAVDVNVSLTLLGTMLGLFPVLLAGGSEYARRMFAPFAVGQSAPLAAFAFSEPGGSANFIARARRRPAHTSPSGGRSLGDLRREKMGFQWHRLGRQGSRPVDRGLQNRCQCTA